MQQLRQPANYDLRRVDELLKQLGEPHLVATTAHIAGTKGKGSSAAMIASALATSGYKTGLYTSPHLIDLRERFRINGRLIPRVELVKLVDRIKPEVTAVNEKASFGRLTTFELLTVLAFLHFAQERVDFQVVEAGLGGRLDATNVVMPEVCVMTSVNLDHTDVLGSSLAGIATEKAGIIKPGVAVVSSPQLGEVDEVIEEACRRNDAQLIRVGTEVTWQGLGFENGRQLLQVSGRTGTYRLGLPLLGRYQMENAATAVATLEVLAERGFSITQESIIDGLNQVNWPGRFQILGEKPLLLVDGAHNPAAARELRQSLEHYFKETAGDWTSSRAILIIGISVDKDLAGIVRELSALFEMVVATRARHPRAMSTATIVAEFGRYGIKARAAETVPQALALAQSLADKDDFICITGSLFVVGDAIEQLARPEYTD
jgi:dihydrofolate synthase/folylpolyglutamate synthase